MESHNKDERRTIKVVRHRVYLCSAPGAFGLLVCWCAVLACSVPTKAQTRAPQERLRAAVMMTLRVLDETPSAIAQVQRFQGAEVIALKDAEVLLATQKSTLLNGIADGPEFEALRSYIEVEFPEIEPSVIRQFDARDGAVVNVDVFQAVVGKVRAFVENMGRLEPLSLNLRIQTRPLGAKVTIRPFLGTRTLDVLSDGEFRNLYRGLYVYTIERANHVSLSGELDLVDDSRERLVCELVPEALVADSNGGCVRTEGGAR